MAVSSHSNVGKPLVLFVGPGEQITSTVKLIESCQFRLAMFLQNRVYVRRIPVCS